MSTVSALKMSAMSIINAVKISTYNMSTLYMSAECTEEE